MKTLFLLTFFVTSCLHLKAQQVFCPPNIDFELGDLSNWEFFIGTCCPIAANNSTQALIDRHTLMNGGGVDLYGQFPVVAPGAGQYSIKLGNDDIGAEAEKARYTFTVPAGLNNYSLIYKYAVVFEDPGHDIIEQPRFEVKIFNTTDNTILPCANYSYIASAGLPGFKVSNVAPDVLYKDWATATIDLSGYAGQTLTAEFSTGDCALGGHFGYGYVDLSCGLFEVAGVSCTHDSLTILNAPPGFEQYLWYDSTLTVFIDSGQSITIQTPVVPTKYKVILSPYIGFGCPDTLETSITVSIFEVFATHDREVCDKDSFQLSAHAIGNSDEFIFQWSPDKNISCTECANPTIFPTFDQQMYYLTVTDAYGCTIQDSVNIKPNFKACCSNVFIPNAFTPNNDGLNDIFKVSTPIDLDLSQWAVFNRWGMKVWSSESYTDGWDGNYLKDKQELGTYFYIFNYRCLFDGKNYIKKGDVTLIR